MKRNTLTTAVLAGLTGMAGMVSVSNAVNVNPDGLGQVLLYPYYSARGGNDTLISIVNTTDRGKAVKIRFIEALNSREVLDFNIYMSPFDVWTAGITANEDGGARMVTADATCTVPYIFRDFDGEHDFLDFEFTGINADGGPDGIERVSSGYIEVIEMGTMLEQPESNPGEDDPSYIPWAAKHVAGGEPRDCQHLIDQWTAQLPGGDLPWTSGADGGTAYGFDSEIGASGGLFGSASIINVPQGTMFSYNATAVDGFWAQGTTQHTAPDSLQPSLNAGNYSTSYVFNNGSLEIHDWTESLFALNATLAYDMLMNEYITDASIGGRTEWVLTFPTKRFHTDAAGGLVGEDDPVPPFTRTWHLGGDEGDQLHHACEDLSFRFWDREEAPYAVEPDDPDPVPPIVSPPRPPEEAPEPDVVLFSLCREANVVRIGEDPNGLEATEILAEPARAQTAQGFTLGFTNFQLPFNAGWVRFDLAQVPAASDVAVDRRQSVPASNGEVFEGLPVIGFSVTTFTNGELEGGVLSNYGGTFNHRGSRSVVTPVID